MANATKVQIIGEDGFAAKVNSDGALEVDATLTPSGTQNVNLAQVNSQTTGLAGAGAVGVGTQRVAIGTQLATYTDRSGTITLGGTAQQLAASNTARAGIMIQNVSSGDLWVSSLTTAVQNQPSMRISPGQTFIATSPDVSSGAISIIGATTSQAFSAREW